jgi:hypothetical protein
MNSNFQKSLQARKQSKHQANVGIKTNFSRAANRTTSIAKTPCSVQVKIKALILPPKMSAARRARRRF